MLMKFRNIAVIVSCLVSLTACTNTGFNGGSNGGFSNGADGNGVFREGSPAEFQNVIGDRVFFAVDQSSLSTQASATLSEQASWLMSNMDYTMIIEGHADEQGTRQYNLALGARRANAVREFLISQGVSSDRLKTVSFGKERPAEICSAESCYSKNRRAVTVLDNLNF